MKLYVGGAHQGKAAYVKEQTGLSPRLCTPEEALSAPAVDQFHRICRTLLEREEDLGPYVDRLLAENPDAVILCDEIGLGVVPLDPFERRWREETGRALCRLAASAARVVRTRRGYSLANSSGRVLSIPMANKLRFNAWARWV